MKKIIRSLLGAAAVGTALVAAGTSAAHAATINGNDAANTLTGTWNGDVIRGYGGNDTIDGKGNNNVSVDYLYGGTGADKIYGRSGPTRVSGGYGVDYIKMTGTNTSTNFDTVAAGPGNDIVEVYSSYTAVNCGDGSYDVLRIYNGAYVNRVDIVGCERVYRY